MPDPTGRKNHRPFHKEGVDKLSTPSKSFQKMKNLLFVLTLFLVSTAAFQRAFGETVALQNIEIDGKTHRYVILTLPPPETTFGGKTKVTYSFNNTKVEATIKTLPPNLKSAVKDILTRRSQSHQWSRILAEESAEAEKILAEAQRLAEEKGPQQETDTNQQTRTSRPGKENKKRNMNAMSKKELIQIPGIGERRAQIIWSSAQSGNPIGNREHLKIKLGVSEEMLDKIETYLYYGPKE